MAKVKNLYGGDMRLDTLDKAITDLIYERVGGQDIPIVSVVGVLGKIRLKLLMQIIEMEEE